MAEKMSRVGYQLVLLLEMMTAIALLLWITCPFPEDWTWLMLKVLTVAWVLSAAIMWVALAITLAMNVLGKRAISGNKEEGTCNESDKSRGVAL